MAGLGGEMPRCGCPFTPSFPEVGDELLDLEEGEWGCLKPLEKGKRGFLDAGLMDPVTVVAAGL